MAVMGLVHLDVDIVAKHPRGHVEQLEAQVDAGAEIGGLANGNPGRGLVDLRLLRGRESGGADDHGDAVPRALCDIGHGRRRHGEVDKHVDLVDDLRQGPHHGHPVAPLAGQLAGIGAESCFPAARWRP